MAKKGAETTDLRSARKQHSRHKRIRRLIIAFVLFLLAFCIYALRGIWVPKLQGIFDKPHGLIVNDGKLAAGNFPLSLSDNGAAKLYTVEDHFASVDDSAVKFYDISGELENTVQHTLAHPSAHVSGKRMLVYENGGNSFEIIGLKGEIYQKKLDENILIADMKNDVTAVVTSTDKYDAYITVYDKEGDVIYKWAANKRISALGVKEDGSGCYIATFTSKDGAVKSVVSEIDFSKEGEVFSSKELDTLVLNVSRNSSNDVWAIGNTALYRLDDAGNVTDTFLYGGELCAYSSNERSCAVAVSGIKRGSSELLIFNSDDTGITGRIDIDTGKVKALRCEEESIFMLSEHSAECYDINGALSATAAVSNDYVDFVYLEDSLIFLGYREINKIEFKS